jgi:hypothetical protein
MFRGIGRTRLGRYTALPFAMVLPLSEQIPAFFAMQRRHSCAP